MAEVSAKDFAPLIAPRFAKGSGAWPYDASMSLCKFRTFTPNTGSQVYLGVTSWNSSEVLFDVSIPAGSKYLLERSFLRMSLMLCNNVAGAPGVITVTEGCPWTPIGVAFKDLEWRSSNGSSLEKQTQNVLECSILKALVSESREALEASSTRYITPCIEEGLDLPAALSAVTRARSLTFVNGAAPCAREFLIPLGDLFPSMGSPVDWTGNRLIVRLVTRSPTEMVFKTTSSMNVPALVITDLHLEMAEAILTPETEKLEASKLSADKTILKLATVYPDGREYVYGPSQIIDATVSNVLGCALMFPATALGTGVSPGQFTLDATSWQCKYGSQPRQPDDRWTFNAANRFLNSRVWLLYSQLCGRLSCADSRLITTALYPTDMQKQNVGGADVSPYGFLCAQFFPEGDAFPHRTSDPTTLEVNAQGGAACGRAVVVRFRMRYMTLAGDYRVSTLE